MGPITPGGQDVPGTTKSKATDKHWIIMFHTEGPDPKKVYDLEVRDAGGSVLAVCKNLQFSAGKNSLTITSPLNTMVCPTFTAYGTSTSQSLINAAGCNVAAGSASVTVVHDVDANGAWIVQFNSATLTAPQSTTVTVAQQDGTSGTNGGVQVTGCSDTP